MATDRKHKPHRMSEDDKKEFYDFFETPISYDVGLPHTGMIEMCERKMEMYEYS
jgi:hypothetical protein